MHPVRLFPGLRAAVILWLIASVWVWTAVSVSARGQTVQKVSLSVGQAAVLEVEGSVQKIASLTPVSTTPVNLRSGMLLSVGDRLKSGADGRVLLGLLDGSTIAVESDTELELLDFSGGVRELFQLWIGRVRLKIRKLVGAPNPYQMHTPIATIGVRGTEFQINVDPNEVTNVRVFEGLVAVSNNQVAGKEVLVSAGKEVTLYPLRPPDPPVTFEQIVAENFNRESTEEYPLLRKFLAFPDSHLDILDNPAYATLISSRSGRFYFYPARTESFTRPEISPLNPIHQFADVDELFATDQRRLSGFSSRFSYAAPVGQWVVAGLYEFRGFDHNFNFKINRRIPSAFGGEVSVEQLGGSLYAPNLTLDSNSQRTVLVAARRFPGQGVAFSFDWSHTGGTARSLYEFQPGGMLLTREASTTHSTSDARRVAVGYQRQGESMGSFALLFRTGFLSGSSNQTSHEFNDVPAPLADFATRGRSYETGVKWRKKLSSSFYMGLVGSLTQTRLHRSINGFRIADSSLESVYWIPTFGAGLGLNWRDRVFGALDYQFTSLREKSERRQLLDGSAVGLEDSRRKDHALHGWLQVQMPASFFVGGGFTSYHSSGNLWGRYLFDERGRRTDFQGRPQKGEQLRSYSLQVDQVGLSAGRRFGDILFLEYQVSQTLGPAFRPLSHSLLLRLAF